MFTLSTTCFCVLRLNYTKDPVFESGGADHGSADSLFGPRLVRLSRFGVYLEVVRDCRRPNCKL